MILWVTVPSSDRSAKPKLLLKPIRSRVSHFLSGSIGASFVAKFGGSGVTGGVEFKTKKSFGGTIGGSQARTDQVSYTLKDNDDGDVFGVKIVRDPMFGTPIFLPQANTRSSWPYEGGYPRDQPSLRFNHDPNITEYTIPNVPIGDPAIFAMNLCNNSDETRTYNLRYLPVSNPNGALISITGTVGDEEYGPFEIEAGDCHPANFIVSINQGNPAALSSPGINFSFYAANEQSIKSDLFATANWGNYGTATNIGINPNMICSGGHTSLTATCPVGTPYWFNQPVGGTSLGSGSPFVRTADSNESYYAACHNDMLYSLNYERVYAGSVMTVTPSPTLSLMTDVTSNTLQVATTTLTANNKILAPFEAIYKAGSSLEFLENFEVEAGALLEASIGGCQN